MDESKPLPLTSPPMPALATLTPTPKWLGSTRYPHGFQADEPCVPPPSPPPPRRAWWTTFKQLGNECGRAMKEEEASVYGALIRF